MGTEWGTFELDRFSPLPSVQERPIQFDRPPLLLLLVGGDFSSTDILFILNGVGSAMDSRVVEVGW